MGPTGWLVSTALRGLDLRVIGTVFGPVDTVFTVSGALFALTALLVWRPVSRGAATRDSGTPVSPGGGGVPL